MEVLQVKLLEPSQVCQFLLINPTKWLMTNSGKSLWTEPKPKIQWLLLAKLVITTLLLVTLMVSLRVSASQIQLEIASIKLFKWETHGDYPNTLDHGLRIQISGLRNGSNKLILQMPIKVNSGYHSANGELTMPKLSILTIEMIGELDLLKENLLNSLDLNNKVDGLNSQTQWNKMLFLSALNTMLDFSHQVARMTTHHSHMLCSCTTPIWTKWILHHHKLNAMVEPSLCQNLLLVATTLELSTSEALTVIVLKSGRWDLSVLQNQWICINIPTHTLNTMAIEDR